MNPAEPKKHQSMKKSPATTTKPAPTPAPAPAPASAPAPAWNGVFFDGPEAEQDREGEEIPVWHVYVGTEDAEPVSRVYRVFSFTKAQSLAQAMSKDRRLELVADATTA